MEMGSAHQKEMDLVQPTVIQKEMSWAYLLGLLMAMQKVYLMESGLEVLTERLKEMHLVWLSD